MMQHDTDSSTTPQRSATPVESADRGATEAVNVLHVINGEFFAGAERVQELLANALPAFGYRVHFICLKEGQFQRFLSEGPHPCQALTMRSRLDIVRHVRSVAEYIRASGCRLVHTHTPRGAVVGSLASAIARVPLVYHLHSPTDADTARSLFNMVNPWVEWAALLRARAVLPVSQSLIEYLRQHGHNEDRVTVIPNGVAVTERQAAVGTRPEVTVGTVALYRPRKGIEVLLQALGRLVTAGVPVRLRAVGGFETTEYERHVRTLCDELGIADRVEWRGFQRDVPAELECMDLLALPSLFGEGMPMVVLEAMAMGLPVVATRVEGVPEVVRDGRDGLLVDPGDPETLANAIATLAREPDTLRAMGASGRRRQRETFSDTAMAERLSRVYDGLLGLHPRQRTDSAAEHRVLQGANQAAR